MTGGDAQPDSREWTFLTNHGHVLICVHRNPRALVREIAINVGITERSVQGILLDLEAAGYLTRDRVGRRNAYRVNPALAFRHPSEAMQPVGELLRIFTVDDLPSRFRPPAHS